MVVATKGGFSRHLRKKSYLKKQLFRTLFLRKALSKASAIHLSGLAEKVSAGSWLDGEPVFYLPNPVDPKKYYPLPTAGVDFRHKFGIPRSSPVVISVGRPVWKKHVELLIGALKKEQDWFLIFVGDGRSGKAPQWKEHAERIGVASRVVWPGFLCGDELLAAFSASNLFALVSENENFGMVVVEAMMCGLPVLISKEVGVQEYIRDQPFVFTGDLSVEAVAEKLGTIERQLDDLQRRREEIRQCAIGQFAPERVAPSFACELRKLLPDHPRTTQVSCLKDNVVPDSEQRVR
jgi:glycosyltransferase involved in cell wall biosynthesis